MLYNVLHLLTPIMALIVDLITNEHAYYGRGHSILSSCLIEWYTNIVNGKSVQAGGQQRIVTIDGFSMPLLCNGGLVYLEFIGIPTDKDLQMYRSVHLTSSHEWDSSALDYVNPDGNGEPSWTTDPTDRSQLDPNFDELGDYVNRAIQILNILDDTPQTSSAHNQCTNKHALTCTPTEYEKLRPYFGWVSTDVVKQTLNQTTQCGVAIDLFPMKRHLKCRNPAFNVPRRHESVAADTISSDTSSGQQCQTSTSVSGEKFYSC